MIKPNKGRKRSVKKRGDKIKFINFGMEIESVLIYLLFFIHVSDRRHCPILADVDVTK